MTFTAESENNDIGQIFVETLEENIKQIYNEFKFPKMIFTRDDKRALKRLLEVIYVEVS